MANPRSLQTAVAKLTDTFARVASRAIRAGASVIEVARRDGWRYALDKSLRVARRHRQYQKWIGLYDGEPDPTALAVLGAEVAKLERRPHFSLIVPVYNTPAHLLRAMIESVLRQVYPHWELCIADDASSAPHVKEILDEYAAVDSRIRVVHRGANGHISEASNSALELAGGEFVVLLDHDDVLPVHALAMVAKYVDANPAGRLFYSDEDKISDSGVRGTPYFKPDWDPALIVQQNYFSHLGVFETGLVRTVGGFRKGLEGSQDHDLVLRCVAVAGDAAVVHIPHVLYHWRMTAGSTATGAEEKPYAAHAAARAVRDHIAAKGLDAAVQGPSRDFPFVRVDYALPRPAPEVQLIVCASGPAENVIVRVCSLLARTVYASVHVSVVGAQDSAAALSMALPSELASQVTFVDVLEGEELVDTIDRVVGASHQPYICLWHESVEPASPTWLSDLLSQATQEGVAMAGPKLLVPSGKIYAAGIVAGPESVLVRAHAGLPGHDRGYFGSTMLAHSVFALPCVCAVVRRDVLVSAGGMRAVARSSAHTNRCSVLRVPQALGRAILAPGVQMVVDAAQVTCFLADCPTLEGARECDGVPAFDPHYNRNLALNGRIAEASFDVAFPPRIERFE
ncbi:glycosyl transferase family 2 [Paraburkholderia unamae]|uniref:glycosyltransferase family 2 protein n=1 Tax=Paraburkholderia unamae TaxID=219649 RepID=UPI000DC44A01|nr:glycosyltransferase [Paraburkholderia unamae]RAR60619.1 glycosyl transferase family 2 [Paraburkholderia unamae]